MNSNKPTRKALRSLINDSMREAISSLELPQPTKKIKKLIERNSKKIASVYSHILKREEKKKKKTEKLMQEALQNGKAKKVKKRSEGERPEPIRL